MRDGYRGPYLEKDIFYNMYILSYLGHVYIMQKVENREWVCRIEYIVLYIKWFMETLLFINARRNI